MDIGMGMEMTRHAIEVRVTKRRNLWPSCEIFKIRCLNEEELAN